MALEREQIQSDELPPRSRASFSAPLPSHPDDPLSTDTSVSTVGQVPKTIEPITGQIPSLATGKRRIPLRLWLPAVLLLVLVVLGSAVYAANEIWFVARATVTIVPKTTTISQSIPVDAVVSPTASQVKVSVYTVTKSENTTHATSGVGHQKAVSGQGTLAFYNLATYQIVIPAGMTFTGSDGVQVATDATITVPAGNPPALGSAFVQAHAVVPGTSGNIGALDVNSALSGNYNGIEVKNPAAFSGGQDEQTFSIVSKADITNAANPLEVSLTQAAQSDLLTKLGSNEQFLAQAACTPTVQADPAEGQAGSQVKVSVQVTCTRAAYNQPQAKELATARFTKQATTQLGTAYASIGSPTTATIQVTPVNVSKELFTLSVPISERFAYQFTPSMREQLDRQLAGTPSSAASSLLLNTPGVAQASIQLTGWNNGNLPTDTSYINVIIATPRSA